MLNKVPEQDPFAVSNEAEENIKLFPSFKVSVKFSLPYYCKCLHCFSPILYSYVGIHRSSWSYRYVPCSMGSSETNKILLFNV